MEIALEVEENGNCFGVPERVFDAQGERVKAARVKAYPPRGAYGWCRITGWSSVGGGTPCDAYSVKVGDSGSGTAYLVYGGDWGVRLMAGDAQEAWSLESHRQWGEPYLLLGDPQEIEASPPS
ncbi:MAG: hypothetical protein HY533_04320 [Chloroflexi bacterium]|nr:hypothetical protein [Chloroflexota bacterium]